MFATAPIAPAHAHCEEREGRSPAFRFPAPSPALNVLRPASIPKSVNLYENAYFDKANFAGPNRHNLIDGLVTLNAMDALGDEALLAVANGSLNDLVIWGYVEAGFSAVAEQAAFPSGHLLSPLIADALPLKSVARYWLNWHDQNAEVIPAEVLHEIEALPEIGTGSQASEALCSRLPDLYTRNQDAIASHLNALCENPGNSMANELPLTFLGEVWDSTKAPLVVGCGDMLGLNFGSSSSDFTPAYWKALVNGLRLIGLCLRPMMTPDEMVDLSPVQMEEEGEDVKMVLAALKEKGLSPDDEDSVEEVIGELELFMVECFGTFQHSLEGYELDRDVRARWLESEPALSVADFAALVANLPEPQDDLEQSVAEWLTALVAALPSSQEDSALHRVRGMAVCDGSLDMMLPVFFEDDTDFAEASIQPAYEVFMSDAEESTWSLGWDIPVALLVQFAEGIRAGNKLLSDLDDRITC